MSYSWKYSNRMPLLICFLSWRYMVRNITGVIHGRVNAHFGERKDLKWLWNWAPEQASMARRNITYSRKGKRDDPLSQLASNQWIPTPTPEASLVHGSSFVAELCIWDPREDSSQKVRTSPAAFTPSLPEESHSALAWDTKRPLCAQWEQRGKESTGKRRPVLEAGREVQNLRLSPKPWRTHCHV